jgi:hypothetical protein
MPDLHGVGSSETLITSDSLSLLAKLPNLETLALDGKQIGDTGLRELAAYPKLEFLHICGT